MHYRAGVVFRVTAPLPHFRHLAGLLFEDKLCEIGRNVLELMAAVQRIERNK